MMRLLFSGLPVLLLLLSGCASTGKPSSADRSAPDGRPALVQHWLDWHQRWAGTPHRLGGNSRRGIDCSAYVQRGYREVLGIELPRTVRQQRRLGIAVSYGHLRTGDLVFFRPDTYPNHVGIYLGDGTFIHVSSKKGVIRSRLDKGYWRRFFRQGRRIVR